MGYRIWCVDSVIVGSRGDKVVSVGRGGELGAAEVGGSDSLRLISSSTGSSDPGERVERSTFATSGDNEMLSGYES
jgi:hypothetical protein